RHRFLSPGLPPNDGLPPLRYDHPALPEYRQSPARPGAETAHHARTMKSRSGQIARPGRRPDRTLSPTPSPNRRPPLAATSAGPAPANWWPDYNRRRDAPPGLFESMPERLRWVAPARSALLARWYGKTPCSALGSSAARAWVTTPRGRIQALSAPGPWTHLPEVAVRKARGYRPPANRIP